MSALIDYRLMCSPSRYVTIITMGLFHRDGESVNVIVGIYLYRYILEYYSFLQAY